MTEPDATKDSGKASEPTGSIDIQKKDAADPGVIEVADVGSGQGQPPAQGTAITPIESTLLGDGTEQAPAAEPRIAEPALDATPEEIEAPEPDPEPAPETTSGPAPVRALPQPVTVNRTGFWPVALGGVVAAGIGAAATIWALPHLPAGWLPEDSAQFDPAAIQAEAVAAAQDAAQQRFDELSAQIEVAAPAGEPAAPEDLAQIDELRQELADMRARIDDQASRIEAFQNLTGIDAETAARMTALAGQAETLEQQIAVAADEARSQIATVQAEAARLQEAAEASTRRAEAVAAVAALQSALDRGVTAADAGAALTGAGINTPEALQRDVPSLASLQEGFAEASRSALRAALGEDSASGGNVVTNFLRAQTGARSVEPREGSDTDAVLSRANAHVEAGHIGVALDEMEALADTARNAPAMAAWLQSANAYRDAQDALSALSDTTH